MIDIVELEQYFPEINKPIQKGEYTFNISLLQDDDDEIFLINLKIKQQDNKESHLIKFRLGLGKDLKANSSTHKTHEPHFEIDIYDRGKNSFSATIYFTFVEPTDEDLLNYAKGTVVIISKIIEMFCKKHKIEKSFLENLVYKDEVLKELSLYEPKLIDALYECYNKSDLVVRKDGQTIVIKTEHNLSKYLKVDELMPLYLPLLDKIRNKKISSKKE